MDKNFVLNGNKLIAEFMGKTISTDGISWFDENFRSINNYHKFWDVLMPVVEKIESLGYPVKITSKYCSVARDYTYKEPLVVSEFRDTKIQKVYDIVTGFIEWYNENK